jgi:hypothetical protein
MPGYARPTSTVFAQEIIVTPSGTLSSTNLAAVLAEIDGDISTTNSSVSSLSSSLSAKADLVAGGTIVQNSQSITSSFTFPSNKNGVSGGPITIVDGVTVTIPDGSAWSIV